MQMMINMQMQEFHHLALLVRLSGELKSPFHYFYVALAAVPAALATNIANATTAAARQAHDSSACRHLVSRTHPGVLSVKEDMDTFFLCSESVGRSMCFEYLQTVWTDVRLRWERAHPHRVAMSAASLPACTSECTRVVSDGCAGRSLVAGNPRNWHIATASSLSTTFHVVADCSSCTVAAAVCTACAGISVSFSSDRRITVAISPSSTCSNMTRV